MPKWHATIDFVVRAPAVFFTRHDACVFKLSKHALNGSFRDSHQRRNISDAQILVAAYRDEHVRVIGEECPRRHRKTIKCYACVFNPVFTILKIMSCFAGYD